MTIIRYGTIPVYNNWLIDGRVRELTDDERFRISKLADRCHRRLFRIIERKNRVRDASQKISLNPIFEPLFDDGFRSEAENRGGLIAYLDLGEITCNFQFSVFQMAYVWKLSRIVKDLFWHYNFKRYFKDGVLFEDERGKLIVVPTWRLPLRYQRFVSFKRT